MTDPEDQRLDDRLARMFRAFQGPADPWPRTRSSRGSHRFRRAVLVTAAAVSVGAIGLGAAFFGNDGEGRRAAVSSTEQCDELRALGRRYVARPIPAGALAVGVPLRARATLVCDGTRVPDADVARVEGMSSALALIRPAERGLVYVAVGRCRNARVATDLVACLHKEGSAP